jgi:hypothetical protein
LLTICQGAAASLSLPVPASVVGNTDANATLFLQLAKREGRELMRRHDWQGISFEYGFQSVDDNPQTLGLPTGFDRFLPDTIIINNETNEPVIGPTPTNVWTMLTEGDRLHWRIFGDNLYIFPQPEAGVEYAYVYVSKHYCQTSGAIGQEDWAADSDTGRIPEHLIELGVVWRWLRAKGMDYAEELATYEREVEKASARDRGPTPVRVVWPHDNDLIPTTWHGTITEV